MVVTPTVELATQLQREVDKLWPPAKGKDDELESAMHVVGFVSGKAEYGEDGDRSDKDTENTDTRPDLLPQIGNAPDPCWHPTITPRSPYGNAKSIDDRDADSELRSMTKNLKSNLKAVVLDEADRLLRTEGKARDIAEVRLMRESGEAPPSSKQEAANKKAKAPGGAANQ